MSGVGLLGAVVLMAVPLWSGATGAAATRSSVPPGSPAGAAGLLARLASGAVEPLRMSARQGGSAAPAAASLACLTNLNPSVTNPQCYSVQQLRTAYDVTPLLDSGITGKGQTIVIIALSSLPTLRSDVHAFDQLWGLSDPRLNIVAPFGATPFIDEPSAFAAEEVEIAHAIAPGAAIDVVQSPGITDNDTTVEKQVSEWLKPLRYAIDRRLGSVIDDDWGIAGESCFDSAFFRYQHTLFQQARARHITVVAQSGFHGAGSFSCPSPAAPATVVVPVTKETSGFNDPLVTTVGGTTLHASVGTGAYQSETTWNEDSAGFGASGGGFSTVFPRPGYQDGIPGISGFRGEPDVAWDEAGEATLPVLFTFNGTLTSSASTTGGPAWAGLVALFDQYAGRPLGFLNQGLYRILNSSFYRQAFHDVTTGDNSVTGSDANGNPVPITGYSAGPGWDPVTGVGSPRAAVLAPLLKRYVHADDGSAM